MPCLDELYIGFFDEVQNLSSVKMNGKFISASKKIDLSDALIATSSPNAFSKEGFQKFQKISEKNVKILIMEVTVITMRYLLLAI